VERKASALKMKIPASLRAVCRAILKMKKRRPGRLQLLGTAVGKTTKMKTTVPMPIPVQRIGRWQERR